MAEKGTTHTFDVGPCKVTLTLPRLVRGTVKEGRCEWDPAMPNRPFTDAERAQYQAGLAKAVELAGGVTNG